MKNFLLSLAVAIAAVAIVSGCGAARMTTAEKALVEQTVFQQLDAKDYTVLIQFMIPSAGPSRAVTNYSVKVSGDTLVSYLPYFGRAYNLPYGGGKGLDFTAPISAYQDLLRTDGSHEILIRCSNDEDSFLYAIDIYGNGNAFLTVSSRNRETISYSGELDLP